MPKKRVQCQKNETKQQFTGSMLEIYVGKIYDLLIPTEKYNIKTRGEVCFVGRCRSVSVGVGVGVGVGLRLCSSVYVGAFFGACASVFVGASVSFCRCV